MEINTQKRRAFVPTVALQLPKLAAVHVQPIMQPIMQRRPDIE